MLDGLPPPLLVHAPATRRRLGLRPRPAYDLLELFAFACPARTPAPTARGLCLALRLDPPASSLEAETAAVAKIASALIGRLAAGRDAARYRDAAAIAARMGGAGWGWAPFVLAALGASAAASPEAFKVWRRLPEWEETAPPPPPAGHPVTEAEARQRLAAILGSKPNSAPSRRTMRARPRPPSLRANSGATRIWFSPRRAPASARRWAIVAPASLWAEKKAGSVWISTYTRNLQRQIDNELARLYPDEAERRRRVVIRKGRENYLCLLNFQEAVRPDTAGRRRPSDSRPGRALGAGDRDGDMLGGDLPGWLAELLGRPSILAGRPARRVHLFRLPALAEVLRRAHHPARPHRRHRDRQPCAGDGAGGHGRARRCERAHPLRVRRGPSPVRRGRRRVLRGTLRRRDRRAAPVDARSGGRPARARGLRRGSRNWWRACPLLEAPMEAALGGARAAVSGWSAGAASAEVRRPELGGLDTGRANPTEAFLRLVAAAGAGAGRGRG